MEKTELPPIFYIRWHDASVPADGSIETPKTDCSPLELHAIGWLECIEDDAIRVGIEYQDGALTSRLWQTIPTACIQEVRSFALPKARKKRKSSKKK